VCVCVWGGGGGGGGRGVAKRVAACACGECRSRGEQLQMPWAWMPPWGAAGTSGRLQPCTHWKRGSVAAATAGAWCLCSRGLMPVCIQEQLIPESGDTLLPPCQTQRTTHLSALKALDRVLEK
jgi:hypothetical protein